MFKPAVGVTLTILTLILTGCSGFNERSSSAAPEEPQTNAAPPPIPEAFKSPETDSAQEIDTLLALTSPTNPDERRLVIRSGRSDPFASVVKITPKATTNPSAKQAIKNRVKAALKKHRSPRALPSNRPKPSPAPKIAIKSPVPASPAPAPVALPPPPQAEVAKGMEVQGILTLGDPQAIVKAPEESTPRTVGVGERLSNGRVVVKGFDLSDPNSPLVIFEEAGTQVAVGVGQDAYVIASAATP